MTYIEKNYFNANVKDLVSELDKSWNAIKLKAANLKLKRSAEFKRSSNLAILTNGSNESLYWLGFLLADGYFDLNKNRIIVRLSDIDYDHIKKFSLYIQSNNISHDVINKTCSVTAQDNVNFNKITQLLKLTHTQKTITPNDFNELNFNNDQLLSLIIGFIDGDGTILNQTNRNDCHLRLHVHKNWFNNILYVENFIYSYFGTLKDKQLTKIGNDGYTRLVITNNRILKELKRKTKEFNLPVLNRKWDKINENLLSKPELIKIYKSEISELYINNTPINEIIGLNKYTKALVYKTIREIKNENHL